jgi:hypothetical protein
MAESEIIIIFDEKNRLKTFYVEVSCHDKTRDSYINVKGMSCLKLL